MSAQDFNVATIVIPDPQYDPSDQARIVNDSLGFTLRASGLIRTLSPNNPHHYAAIQGLLYSPEIPATSPCNNFTRSLIPANVTTRAQIPPLDLPLVALAPWSDPDCVQSIFAVLQADQVRGAIFFHPDNSSALPPPVSDVSWTLHDGGQWKSTNQYPVYAIPGMLGTFLLNELSLYSGNMSEVPFGSELEEIYDFHDSVRLYTRMNVNTTSGIPSLWIFLIIVLAILLAFVLLTSVFMHYLQRRQRRSLQRRVANGEVDLETLGIKRLQVPQEMLDKMPQYTYTSKPEPAGENAREVDKVQEVGDAVKPAPEKEAESHSNDIESAIGPAVTAHRIAFSQSTCPICLDDFVNEETTVRELPCNHIFHPECIDPFLRDNSSLCPLCKKSSLPAGYCPVEVTNLMVRRERLMRQVQRQGGSARLASHLSHTSRRPGPFFAIRSHGIRGMSIPGPAPRIDIRVPEEQVRSAATELDSMPSPPRRNTAEDGVPAEVRAQGASARRAWLRERLARTQARDYEQRANQGLEAEASRPLWRRAAGRLFPSL